MIRILVALALIALAPLLRVPIAWGQVSIQGMTSSTAPSCKPGDPCQLSLDPAGNLRVSGGTTAGPVVLVGTGTLAVTTTSVAISSLTPGSNSPAWSMPRPGGGVTIANRGGSASEVYFCPLGGTCTAAGNIRIDVGGSVSVNIGPTTTTSPTVVAASTATIEVTW